MSEYLLQDYLPALANTLAIELGVALLLGFWNLRSLGVAALVSLVTHPLLHGVLWLLYGLGGEEALGLPEQLGLEVAVFLAEGAMLRRWLQLPARRAFLMSAAMNGASYLLGFVLPGP